MKKLFTSFLAAGTVASFAFCAQNEANTAAEETTTEETTTEETTTEETTTTVVRGEVQKGTFKIGVVGSSFGAGTTTRELADVVVKYSQDVKNPEATDIDFAGDQHSNKPGTGEEYFKLPSGLFLITSFEKWIELSGDANGDGSVSDPEEETKPIQLTDKTKMASSKLDTLFIGVTDERENNSDVYKSVVEKKEFGETKLFFVGEESKAQSGASSKVFAGENVSTASFNEYAAAYIGGFQAAVGAIKFSGSEDVYEETSVSFLIGSTSESGDKKKAFAFRRGVEAAAAHESYSKYLKVKFVSKTEDSSKSSKKLYREISEWKAKDDSKSKLYEFSSSDTFSDADRRVVYIAGATARDWSGKNADDLSADESNKFKAGDDAGLVGALYNYKDLPAAKAQDSTLTSKTFSRGVWVVLDEATAATAANDAGSATTNLNDLTYIKSQNLGQINLERHEVKFYGSLGKEASGTSSYAAAALKGLYMGGPSYMIGKHTIFGAKLNVTHVNGEWTTADSEKLFPWRISSTGSKDSNTKAEARFKDSFAHATEKELIEEELVKTSPWLK